MAVRIRLHHRQKPHARILQLSADHIGITSQRSQVDLGDRGANIGAYVEDLIDAVIFWPLWQPVKKACLAIGQ